jgi:hypothetical protein
MIQINVIMLPNRQIDKERGYAGIGI